jgi:hypothetical protein
MANTNLGDVMSTAPTPQNPPLRKRAIFWFVRVAKQAEKFVRYGQERIQ